MIITLTTDFGLSDGYVGVMKGVISSIAPGIPLVDVTHTIASQDVRAAAYVLWTSLPYFPEQSVHLVVVDPGVGTARRALASQTPWGTLVGPDNGVFSYVWAAAPPGMTVALDVRRYQGGKNHRVPVASRTFHGRDIFAPAAAQLASGVPLQALGLALTDPVRLPLPLLDIDDGGKNHRGGKNHDGGKNHRGVIRGEVVYIDHFGNVITSIGRLVWDGGLLRLDPAFGPAASLTINPDRVRVAVGERDLGPIRRTYGEVAAGASLVLVGSEGLLEVAVNQGHGARDLGLEVGDPVLVTGSRPLD